MVDSLQEAKKIIINYDRVILKFSAKWCAPCNRIKSICDDNFNKLTDSGVKCVHVDIDDEIDLYMLLKQKRMITSIPSLCYYYGNKENDAWFVPDEIYAGSNMSEVQGFFDKCDKLRE